mgnify:CR=1 FL=1
MKFIQNILKIILYLVQMKATGIIQERLDPS